MCTVSDIKDIGKSSHYINFLFIFSTEFLKSESKTGVAHIF